VKKTKAKKVASKKSAPKAKKTAKAKPAAKPSKKEPEIMERSNLKAMATHLKEAGVEIKVLKSDTDEQLQKKVNEAIQELPTGEILKKLESVSPDKLVSLLKRDCMGIFINLSDVSCVQCADNVSCVKQFVGNLKSGFADIEPAAVGTKVEKPKQVKISVPPVSLYSPDRLVFVRDRPNPNEKTDDYYDTVAAILKEEPTTMSELRDIVARDFEIESNSEFMKFVTRLREPSDGIIKLVEDLSDKDKNNLREAGYDV
jgi:hypothetical protein